MGTSFRNIVAGARPGTRHLIALVAVLGAFLILQPPARAEAFTSSNPVGSFDVATYVPGGLRVAGWALDPDTADPIGVHLYVNQTLVKAFDAGMDRSDVGSAYPGYGDAHGFDTVIEMPEDSFDVCAYGINVAGGDNELIDCWSVMDPHDPMGMLDEVALHVDGTRMWVAGWAIDPDTANSIVIHVYVDDVFAGAFEASARRSDIASAFPGYGDAHGFDVELPLGGVAPTSVAVYGINQGSGANVLLHRVILCEPVI